MPRACSRSSQPRPSSLRRSAAGLPERIGHDLHRRLESILQDVPRLPQLGFCLRRRKAHQVRVAVGMRADLHSLAVQLRDLGPAQPLHLVAIHGAQAREAGNDLRLASAEAGGGIDGGRQAIFRQQRQRVLVVVGIAVVEGNRDGRPRGVAVARSFGELVDEHHLAIRLQPGELVVEEPRGCGGVVEGRVDRVVAEGDRTPGGPASVDQAGEPGSAPLERRACAACHRAPDWAAVSRPKAGIV